MLTMVHPYHIRCLLPNILKLKERSPGLRHYVCKRMKHYQQTRRLISSVTTYNQIFDKSNTTVSNSGTITTYPSGTAYFIPFCIMGFELSGLLFSVKYFVFFFFSPFYFLFLELLVGICKPFS